MEAEWHANAGKVAGRAESDDRRRANGESTNSQIGRATCKRASGSSAYETFHLASLVFHASIDKKHAIRFVLCITEAYVSHAVFLGSSWRWREGSVICSRDRGCRGQIFHTRSHNTIFIFPEAEACRFVVAHSYCKRLWIPKM